MLWRGEPVFGEEREVGEVDEAIVVEVCLFAEVVCGVAGGIEPMGDEDAEVFGVDEAIIGEVAEPGFEAEGPEPVVGEEGQIGGVDIAAVIDVGAAAEIIFRVAVCAKPTRCEKGEVFEVNISIGVEVS